MGPVSISIPCPLDALPRIADQLRTFGVSIIFYDAHSGIVESHAGKLSFSHSDGCLTVYILRNEGHFSNWLLIGGIRQLVEESVRP